MLRRLQGRQIVGSYPLLADETCWLLAIDFDGDDWPQRGRVTPAERARRPRVVALAFAPGDVRGAVLFEAQIDDGASRYRLRLRVAL